MPLPKKQQNNHKAHKRAERSGAPRHSAEIPTTSAWDYHIRVERELSAAAQDLLVGDGPPTVTDLDCAFPTRWRELLPPWEELTKEERSLSTKDPFMEALSSIFYRGGTLKEYGIHVKTEFDEIKVIRYIRATLGDYGPSHEHKIGGIAHNLKKWCVYKKKGK